MSRRLYSLLSPSSSSTRSSLPILSSSSSAHTWSAGRYKKTGRVCGIAVTPGKMWRYNRSAGRVYNMEEGKRFGFDVGLEDRILLLTLSNKDRRLDDNKRRRLADIFESRLADLVASNETLAEFKLTFTKVKVDKSFSEVVVWWLAKGEGDDEIADCLENERHVLRRQLADATAATVPEVKFTADRINVRLSEMDALFKKADYGMDYRALSETGRVLGAVKDEKEETEERKEKPPPLWKMEREEKKRTNEEESK